MIWMKLQSKIVKTKALTFQEKAYPPPPSLLMTYSVRFFSDIVFKLKREKWLENGKRERVSYISQLTLGVALALGLLELDLE